MNTKKKGCHNADVLRVAHGMSDVESCYGEQHLRATKPSSTPTIKMITAAPEMGDMCSFIPELRSRNIIYSIGHSDATYSQALAAVDAGANMITHLFNGMRSFSHRDPGIFGLLGQTTLTRPYYGIIADGVHLHPTSVRIAADAHPDGLILVTDAMRLAGCPDGVYEWINGSSIVKKGPTLTLAGSDIIAGSSITLIECVNNFLRWADGDVVRAVDAVTATPAAMLGLVGVKGSLVGGADADLVVLNEWVGEAGETQLGVEQVWKFGEMVFEAGKEEVVSGVEAC